MPKPKRDPAPAREATTATHRKHASEFLTRPEHGIRPKGQPDPKNQWDEPPNE